MHGRDRLAAHDTAALARRLRLFMRGVHGAEPVESRAECRAEALVCRGLVQKQRITPRLRDIQGVQEGRARRLGLVSYITVPEDGVGTRFKERRRVG